MADGPTVECIENGPYIVKNARTLERTSGEDLGADERMALCRCGESSDKPFCDGTHRDVGFEAPGTPEPGDGDGDDELAGYIKVRDDGPLLVEGIAIEAETEGDDYVLCRCGASDGKPFCDGSHRDVGFTDPGS